jgi:hypothetical protein
VKFIVAVRFRAIGASHRGESRSVNAGLTITSGDLLKGNYNSMNQVFTAIIVKIAAPIFTIPTRFAVLL